MSKKMPSTFSELYPDKWLRPEDLKGRTVVLTVTAVTVEELHNPMTNEKQPKAILDFNRSKRMVLNKTQCEAMMCISDTEVFTDWKGVKIALPPAKASNGKATIAITKPPEADPPKPPGLTAKTDDVACTGCGELMPPEMTYEVGEDSYCPPCYREKDKSYPCVSCNSDSTKGEIINDQFYCENCAKSEEE